MTDIILKSKEYKKMRAIYSKNCFKLFGKYAWYEGNKIEIKSVAEVQEYFKNKRIKVSFETSVTDKKGNVKTETVELEKSFYEVWSHDPDMLEYTSVVFECDQSLVTKNQYNCFRGCGNHLTNVKPVDKINLDRIYEHIKSLVNYIDSDFEYLLNYLAQIVQQPHILPHVCLVFISAEGVGKDIFAKFISSTIGMEYCTNTEKLDQICGKFNSLLGGKLLVTINETNPVESRERIENIKFLVTAENLELEAKHKDPIKTKNFARFMFFSNRLTAFPIDDKSRRPKIIQSSNKYTRESIGAEKNKEYFDPLVKQYQNEQYQKMFLDMLKARDISKFNPQLFEKTKLHKELEDHSKPPHVQWLANLVTKHLKKDIHTMSSCDVLKSYNQLLKDQNLKYEMSQKTLNLELKNNYDVKIDKSSVMMCRFDIPELRKLLETKHEYTFDDDAEVDDDEDALENGVDKTDKAVKLSLEEQIEHYTKLLNDLKKKRLEEITTGFYKNLETKYDLTPKTINNFFS